MITLLNTLVAPLIAHATGRWLPGPLALWGKLPGHADYVNLGTPPRDAQAWQAWIAQYWCAPESMRPKRRNPHRDSDAQPWLNLSPMSTIGDLQTVPVAFAMPLPGPWLAGPMVRGVIIASSDRIGRPHPLIIYQRVQERWLVREPVESTGQDLPYWLARLLLRWQQGSQQLPALVRALELLNAAGGPGRRQLFGGPPQLLHYTFWQTLLDELDKDELPDATRGLRGRATAPKVKADRALFWQQDALGGYLRTANFWSQLWEI